MFAYKFLTSRQIPALVLFSVLLLSSGCKKSPTAPDNAPKGNLVQKIVYTTFKPTGPHLNVADLYARNGVFSFYNTGKIVNNGSTASLVPDGSWLVYTYVYQYPRLMRMNMDGTDQREIVLSQSDSYVQAGDISPDGNSIAVLYQKFQNYDGTHVGVMGSNGQNFHSVFADSSQCGPPSWSPDGKLYFAWFDWKNRFGYNPTQISQGRSYICSVNVDGSDWKVVSDTVGGLSDDFCPRVSPDGKFIVFISPRTNFPPYLMFEIFVMNIDGSNVQRITQVTFNRNGNHFDNYTTYDWPRWLPDSRHILFQYEVWTYSNSSGQPEPSTDLYVVNVDGTGLQRLTDDGYSELMKR